MDANRIPSIPGSMYYFPNFITEDEERMILEKACTQSHHGMLLAKFTDRSHPTAGFFSPTDDYNLFPLALRTRTL